MLASLAPARRRLLISLIVVTLAAIATVIALAVPHGGAHRAVPQGHPGPVLLVPGYGGSTSALRPLETYLQQGGRDVRTVSLPDHAEGDLDAQARALGQAVQATLAQTQAGSLDVVGYSAGGVVARLWARDDGGAAVARRIVTIGAPHHGTELAALGTLFATSICPLACQELAPNSPALARLNSGDETPDGPRFTSIWTTHDDVVVPPDSARLDGATNLTVQMFCPRDTVRHSGLPSDPVVQQLVRAELAASVGKPTVSCRGVSS